MGGITETFKKFFTNKTTVTILGVIVGLAVLVGFYLYRVQDSVSPTKVPIATRAISATEEITADDIEYISVSSDFLNSADIITDVDELIGYYVTTGTSIPEGGMFYKSQIVEKKYLPNAVFDEIPDGYTIYQLAVDSKSTYANSIYPGDKIDLYMKTTSDDLLVFGKFISNIEVLAVRDSQGNNVFDSTSDLTPAWLLFAVPTEMYRYLKIAEYIGNMTIVPVPRNNLYSTETGSTEYSSDELIMMIEAQSMDM